MLNICFTADHELFAGQNYASEDEIVIQPTYALMKVLKNFDIPLCLMTDVCALIRHRELEIKNSFVSRMEEQLCYAVAKGHDVQLHIHPHWLTSKYVDAQWDFDYSKLRLHSFGFGKDHKLDGQNIIAQGRQYLLNLLKPVDSNYDCVAFRAGGWCLQPEEELLRALVKAGILIDTTVYYGGFKRDLDRFYDFRRVPSKPNWWINPKKGLEFEAEKAEGNLFEVAIGSYKKRMLFVKKLLLKPYRMKSNKKRVKRLGDTMDDLKQEPYWKKMLNCLESLFYQPIIFSFDLACKEVMLNLMNYYLKTFNCENQEIYISIIGHPKRLTDSGLNEIGEFCQVVSDHYRSLVRFFRLRDLSLKLKETTNTSI